MTAATRVFHSRSEHGGYAYRPISKIALVPLDRPAELRRDIGLLEPTISSSMILERYLTNAVAPEGGNAGNRNNLGFKPACQLRDNAIPRDEAER